MQRRASRIVVLGVLACCGGLGAGAAAAGATGGGSTPGRATVDRVDDASNGANQVHAVYALPSDGGDRGLDTNGTIAGSVESWLTWMAGQTGGPTLRVDRFGGAVDVTFVRLRKTEAEMEAFGEFIRDEIERQMAARGLLAKGKIYAVYYDGAAKAGACASGAWPPQLPGVVGAMYLQGTFDDPRVPPCAGNPFAAAGAPPGYMEFSALHEMLHVLGNVPTCAVHHTRAGHTSDSPTDLMYAGDEPWNPQVLDFGRDDYYGTDDQTCPDLADSPFMSNVEPAPAPSCIVPRLVGRRLPAARTAASNANCELRRPIRRAARTKRQRRKVGRIVAQKPAAGTVMPAGGRLQVTVMR